MLDGGTVLHVKGKTGWREIEIGRGSNDLTCPVTALEQWVRFARIKGGPVFRRVSGDGKRPLAEERRLNDRHVARLVRQAAAAAAAAAVGLRGDLPEGERRLRFAGHSLRAGLATLAEAEERHVQRRRDRFRVNLTKAAGP